MPNRLAFPEASMVRPVRPLPGFVLAAALLPASPALAASTTGVTVELPWIAGGSVPGARFGHVVAPAGDVDGDGFGDVLVGAPDDRVALDLEGRAYLYRGTAQGLSATPAWSWRSGQAGARAGSVVAAAGDVNRDGYGDVLVGTPLWDAGLAADVGKISIFHGGPDGLPATPTYELFGGGDGAAPRFGSAAGTAGDVNGDGYADVVVGAPGHSAGGIAGRGAAFIHHGGPGGLAPAPLRTLLGPHAGSQFGAAVSTAGDLDADGYADVLVGAPNGDLGIVAVGLVQVHRGSAGGVLAVADTVLNGGHTGAQYGWAVANAGDVQGDGHADILVGSPGNLVGIGAPGGGSTGHGRFELLLGGPGGVAGILWSRDGDVADERLGESVATLGDTDGDGYADFAVGAPGYPAGGGRRGRVLVYDVGDGVVLLDDLRVDAIAGATFGVSVATAGDLDGDGRSEFLVGDPGASLPGGALAEGRALLFARARSRPTSLWNWPVSAAAPGTGYGASLAILPLHRGALLDPAYPMLAIGEPVYSGSGRVLLHDGWRFGALTTPATTHPGPAGSRLGSRLAEVGDHLQNGHSDLAVSAPGATVLGATEAGRVLLYPGTAAGGAAPLIVLEGSQPFEHVGAALAGRGDVDGDGAHDFLVGAPAHDGAGGADCGKAWLVYGTGPTAGAPQPPAGSPQPRLWSTEGAAPGQGLGASLALLDLDADGYSDVVVGSSPPGGAPGAGQVQVWYGGPGGLEAGAPFDWSLTGVPPSPSYASAMAAVGDVSGDGVADLAVGAPSEDGTGRVYVYAGTPSRARPELPWWTVRGTQGGARFGAAMAGGGDMDGDGVADLVVGEPGWDGGQADEGRLHLFHGSTQFPEPSWLHESDMAGAELGAALSPLADLNLDSFADLVAGAPGGTGSVHGFFGGGEGGTLRPIRLLDPVGGYVARFHPARFTDAGTNGVAFILRSAEGRAKLGFQFELVTPGHPFTGAPSQAYPTFFDTGPPAVSFGSALQIVTSLEPSWLGIAQRVRVRSTSRSPFFPQSRWMTPEAHVSGDHDWWRRGSEVDAPAGPPDAALRFTAVDPNPGGAGTPTRLRFALPRPARVTIALHDARGARVRTLVDGPFPAGVSAVAWDGLDGHGRGVPAGLYFALLTAEGRTARARLVRLP